MATNNSANFGTGTSGQVLTSNGTGVAPTFQTSTGGTAPGGGLGFPPWATLAYQVGGWSPILCTGTTSGAGYFAANKICLIPAVLPSGITVTSMSINCAVRVGTDSVRMGVYTMAKTAEATLLADFGTVSVASTGLKTISSLSTVLVPGYYYFAVIFASVTNTYTVPSGIICPLYTFNDSFQYNNGTSTFPASVTAANISSGGGLGAPRIGITGTLT